MHTLDAQVVVIGGGATGTAVLRDLALRGVEAVLFERGNLSEGTTGNFHGLLHSGGRYVVSDRAVARQCIEENRILRHIAPQAIEDTGGFFVVLNDEDEEYLPRFLEGCAAVGIPTETLSGAEARREEPHLSPSVRRAVAVPDGSIDGWDLCLGCVTAAKEHGARVFLYAGVTEILREGDRVVGVRAASGNGGEEYPVRSEYVVNASGPWAAQVAALGGVKIQMALEKGTMVVLDGRPVKRVINRCRYPGDGDIIVPVGTAIVLGTTAVPVADPDNYITEEWEIDRVLDECVQMVPQIDDMGLQRVFASVRPLYRPPGEPKAGEVSRAFYVLDHEELDGVGGFVTITGGKLTTARLMAERTVDLVCSRLGVDAPCRTHLEPLPRQGG